MASCAERVFESSWAPYDPREPAQRLMLKSTSQHQQHITPLPNCHLTHVSRLSHASESAPNMRGLTNSFWLMLGTSIDLMLIRDFCPLLGAVKHTAEMNATAIHGKSPGSTPLRLDYCTIARLNFTLGHIGHRGLATLPMQMNDTWQSARFAEVSTLVQSALGRMHASPDFVSFAGIEWDFKQWGLQHRPRPVGDDDWRSVRRSLTSQLDAAMRAWPRVRGLYLRTQYATTYRWYKDWTDANASEYAKYNAVVHDTVRTMRDGRSCGGDSTDTRRVGTHGHHIGERGHGERGHGEHGHGERGHGEHDEIPEGGCAYGAACGRIDVLDMARLFTCSAGSGYPGGCSSSGGWTGDGLHPAPWALRGYADAALNMLADAGEACPRSDLA